MRTCVQARQKKSKRKGESNDEVKALFIQIAGDYNAGRGRTVRGAGGLPFPLRQSLSVASCCESSAVWQMLKEISGK